MVTTQSVPHLRTPWAARVGHLVDGAPDVAGLRRTAIAHEDGQLYLERFHLVDTRDCCIRIHHWCAGDDKRAMHDHPWANSTTVLAGELVERTPGGAVELGPGSVVTREAKQPHLIELVTDDAWTLFVTGPVTRRWGFHTDQGWKYWQSCPWAGRYVDFGSAGASRDW